MTTQRTYPKPAELTVEQLPADLTSLPLGKLAESIAVDWKNVWFGARPYLDAMLTLDSINQNFGLDSGREIVTYFLANAQTYRGENARRLKAELHRRLKGG
jgi:hypothetical protein